MHVKKTILLSCSDYTIFLHCAHRGNLQDQGDHKGAPLQWTNEPVQRFRAIVVALAMWPYCASIELPLLPGPRRGTAWN